jgi:hypothetical protein
LQTRPTINFSENKKFLTLYLRNVFQPWTGFSSGAFYFWSYMYQFERCYFSSTSAHGVTTSQSYERVVSYGQCRRSKFFQRSK